MSKRTIFTIGHSTRTLEHFFDLLSRWAISAVVDVRSSPWSRYNPHYNRFDLRKSLAIHGFGYRFYGRQLGGRPESDALYDEGVADYAAMARTTEFQSGIKMVMDGANKHTLALMCSEHDPIECHRCLLVGRQLNYNGFDIQNIISSNEVQSQGDIEDRILKLTGHDQSDFLNGAADPIGAAYRDWSKRVAYSIKQENWPDRDVSYAEN